VAGTKKQIPFLHLWAKLPRPSAGVWKRTPGREVLELLCGALWHLELAAEIGGGFPIDNMQTLHGGANVPWEDWLNQQPVPSIRSEEHQLTIHYTFRSPLNARLQSLVQTTLLANGALRIAGARDVLRYHLRRRGLSTLPAVLEDYRSILDSSGNFLTSPPLSRYKEQILKRVLIVVAFRDSIMHGELFSGASNESKKFRKLWIKGRLNQNRPKYSPAVIAQACRGVWENLVGGCVRRL
jgi:hypothetical protein